MFGGFKKHRLPGFGVKLFGFAVRVREASLTIGEKYGDTLRVSVHLGLLAGPVPDADHPHIVVFEFHIVVFGIHFHGIMRHGFSPFGSMLVRYCAREYHSAPRGATRSNLKAEGLSSP